MIIRVNSARVQKTNMIQVTIQTSKRVVYEIGGVTVDNDANVDANVKRVVIDIITRPWNINKAQF